MNAKANFCAVIAVIGGCCFGTAGAQDEETKTRLRAPVPGIDEVIETSDPEVADEEVEQGNEADSQPGLGLDFMFRNATPEGAARLLRYDELLTLIANREVESVTIDHDLSIALALPRSDSKALTSERLVSLPYWSYRDSPDFVLRQMCESYGTTLIIAADGGDQFQPPKKNSIFRSLGFWSMVGTGLNFILLLALFRKLGARQKGHQDS